MMVEMLMIAKGADEFGLLPGLSNRHGLVAGATGTGKTVTLQVMAEGLSSIGVPVFAADVKGEQMAAGSNPLNEAGGLKQFLRHNSAIQKCAPDHLARVGRIVVAI